MEEQLQKAIELAKAGYKAEARDLLIVVLMEDSSNVAAWKWYASVAESRDDAEQAIDSILQLEPADAWALRAKMTLEQRRQARAAGSSQKRGGGRPVSRAGAGLAVGLAVVVVGLCVAGVALAMVGTAVDVRGVLGGLPGVTNTPAPVVLENGAADNQATLPPTWTASPIPTLPTLTPVPTLTLTNSPGPSVTPQPTPAVIDPPPDSDFDQVPVTAPPDAAGSVVESSSTAFYPVTGSNANEINQSILDNGPTGNGQDAIAQVAYTISLHYSLTQSASSCTPDEAVAFLVMEFTYPQYTPPAGVSQQILNQWDAFFDRVETHEETHAQIARECAQDMVDSFYTLPPAPSCNALQANLEALQAQKDQACDSRQIAFDVAEGGDSFP